jgi:tripartite-type tricarboxylate transporter receptor subunit TctC
VAEAFEKVGSAAAGSTPAQLGDLIKSQVALWAKVIDEAGLRAQQ